MKVIYLFGPFRGPNAWEIEQNIRRSEALALQVWRLGAACLCPHTNTRHFDEAAPDEIFLEGDLEMLRRCDAALAVTGWRRSKCATRERAEAHARGIPVFLTIKQLRRWLKQS